MNAFQAKLANFLLLVGVVLETLKSFFCRLPWKEMSQCARVTRLVVLFSLLVPLLLFFLFLNSLRPQWALAEISAGHVTGKNIWDWTLFSSASVSIMNSSTGRNFMFPYFLNSTETWKRQFSSLRSNADCLATYIGETGRNLTTRLNERKRATKKGDLSNNISDHHLVKTSHTIDWDSATCVTYSIDNY